MSKERLVVIGNGMAGMRTVEELLKLAPDLYDITVFGAEPHGNYNRILLSPVLAGDKSIDDIMLNTREWYEQNHITLHAGDPVEQIDRRKRTVRSQAGVEIQYDRLLLATRSALEADGDLLAADERAAIDAAMVQLAHAATSEDAALVEAQSKALAQATEAFAAMRMNKGIAQALAGKNIESI